MKVIELTKGFVAVVSKADYRKVCRHSWSVHTSKGTKRKPGQPYARASIKGKRWLLHRYIACDCDPSSELPKTLHVDHINHQTLDCRRENLQILTNHENQRRRRNVRKRDNPTPAENQS